MRDREEENPEIYALKEEIELCHRKLEGLDEIIDKLKAENERLREVAAAAENLIYHLGRQEDTFDAEERLEQALNAIKETK